MGHESGSIKLLMHPMDMCSKVVLFLVVEAAAQVFYAGPIWDLKNSPKVRNEWNDTIDNSRFMAVIVYRPPYSPQHPVTVSTFLTEFSDYLERTVLCNEPLQIFGDLKFLDLLDYMGLKNHIFFRTHESGHALDLFITRLSDRLGINNP